MRRPARKRARSGCSGCGALIFLCLGIGAVFGWPIYLDTHGNAASGVISDKLENVRIHYDQWFRRFQVIATYSVPSQVLEHRAICDVDEKTYDSLHRGNTVEVHYFAGLLNQPFLPATHLALCSTMASISMNPAMTRNLVIALVSLLLILFLWRVLRMRIAAWLLLPWLVWCFALFAIPRMEPQPEHPVAATATVIRLATITTLGAMPANKSIPLTHPFEIVLLMFIPPGMDTAVTAVDKIDVGSVPDLKEGQSADIIYDAEHPRIARLRQGTRSFPGHAMTTVVLCCVAFAVVVAIAGAIGKVFRLLRMAR